MKYYLQRCARAVYSVVPYVPVLWVLHVPGTRHACPVRPMHACLADWVEYHVATGSESIFTDSLCSVSP